MLMFSLYNRLHRPLVQYSNHVVCPHSIGDSGWSEHVGAG